MKKTALILILITIFSQISGFARDLVLSYFYGTSSISDAYLISTTIPIVLFVIIGTVITTGYIPMYSKIATNFGKEKGNRYTNNLVNLLFIISTMIFILGSIFTSEIVKVFASGFKGEALALTIKFTKITIVGIYFTGVISIFSGFLEVNGNYIIPALIGFPLNFFIIVSIFISKTTNILVLVIGSVVAIGSQLLLIIPFIYKKGYRYKLIIDIKDDNIKTMAFNAWPVIIGISANNINLLVERNIASHLAVGGISVLNYASRLNGAVQTLFVSSIAAVLFPMMSKMVAGKNIVGLKKSLFDAIVGINLIVIPITIGTMVFAEPLVRLMFGRGAFDSKAISMTSYTLFFYSIGMVGFVLKEILSRAFYSLHDIKTPMVNVAISLIMNIVLIIVLSKFMGIGGLALATSISAIFCTVLLFISLRKKIGPFGMKNITISFFKILFASLVIGFIAKFTYNTFLNNMSASLSLITSIGISILIYFLIIYLMKIEVQVGHSMFKKGDSL